MPRMCGVCQRPPREGEEMRPMRLTDQDLESGVLAKETGLYSACLECVEAHRQRVAQRIGKDSHQVTNHELC